MAHIGPVSDIKIYIYIEMYNSEIVPGFWEQALRARKSS